MVLEIKENGVVIRGPRDKLKYENLLFNTENQSSGIEWTFPSVYLSWRDGALWCADRIIQGKPTELKPIEDLMGIMPDAEGWIQYHDRLLTGTLTFKTLTKKGAQRVHIYNPSGMEQIELANHPALTRGKPLITLRTSDKIAKDAIQCSEDTKQSFTLPAENICELIQPDDEGHSDFSRDATVRKILTPEGAKIYGTVSYDSLMGGHNYKMTQSIRNCCSRDEFWYLDYYRNHTFEPFGKINFTRSPLKYGLVRVQHLLVGCGIITEGDFIGEFHEDTGRAYGGSRGEKMVSRRECSEGVLAGKRAKRNSTKKDAVQSLTPRHEYWHTLNDLDYYILDAFDSHYPDHYGPR